MADEIKWITVNHVHIPILLGQTKKQAIDNFVNTLQESKSNKKKSTKQLIVKLTQRSEEDKEISNRKRIDNNKRKTISREHYSRLMVMWSDYNRGASRPIEKDGIKFFNVDKTVYYTKGEYPYFYVTQKRTFQNHELVIMFLKELLNE